MTEQELQSIALMVASDAIDEEARSVLYTHYALSLADSAAVLERVYVISDRLAAESLAISVPDQEPATDPALIEVLSRGSILKDV